MIIDDKAEMMYNNRVTERALRIFHLAEYLLLSSKPALGINPLALRDTKANEAKAGYFISNENDGLLAKDRRRFRKGVKMCVLTLRSIVQFPLTVNLIGGVR